MMKTKIFTQEQIREKIVEFLKDCDEETFMKVTQTCFAWACPEFEQESDERGFRKISMVDF